MNKFIEENKKKIIMILIIVSLTLLISIMNLTFNNSNKLLVEEALEELGGMYYEELYHPRLKKEYSNYKEILEGNSIEGIKITLADLIMSIDNLNIDNFVNEKNNTSCDFYLTYIIIYPTVDYGVKDYTMKITTKCDISFSNEGNVKDEKNK